VKDVVSVGGALTVGNLDVFAFAAVIDNLSQDPRFSPGLRKRSKSPASLENRDIRRYPIATDCGDQNKPTGRDRIAGCILPWRSARSPGSPFA
jgi:hypothetical protein